jgi:Kef-type K+ transport system membrane component KefB
MHLDLLNLLLVLVAAFGGGRLASRIGYPAVLGEILAGIVFGPPLLGWIAGSESLNVLAEIGVLCMMLYIGMEIDPRELGKASVGGVLAALGGFLVPFGAAFGVTWVFLEGQDPRMRLLGALFVGTAAGVTSLSTKSRILVDLDLLDTRLAHVMMAGALISDTLCLIVMAGLIGTAKDDFSWVDLAALGARTIGFFLVVGLIGLWVLPAIGRWMTRLGLHNRTSLFTVVLVLAISFAELAELAGLHGILGAFIAGLFIRDGVFGRRLSLELAGVVRDASVGFLAPIFFVTAGFAVTFTPFTEDLGLLLALVGVATLGKIVGTALFYLPSGNGWREGLVLGGAMNGRGAVEIIMAGIGLQLGLITEGLFSVLVFMAIFTTATVPVLLKLGADWLRRRGELVRIGADRRGTLIVGASPLALALARVLAREDGHVTLIDTNEERVAAASAAGFRAICGDALLEGDLGKASADTVAHVVAMTPNPTVNMLSSKIAAAAHDVPDALILQVDELTSGRMSALRLLGAATLFGVRVPIAEVEAALEGAAPILEEVRYTPEERATWGSRTRVPIAWRREGRWVPFSDKCRPDPDDRIAVAVLTPQPGPTA